MIAVRNRTSAKNLARIPGAQVAMSRPAANELLARLPAADYERLLLSTTSVRLERGRVLHSADKDMGSIYFPGGGVCSMTQTTMDGQRVEIAAIGKEGVVGVTALFGSGHAICESTVLIGGDDAHVMDISVFRSELERGGAFHAVMNRYAEAFVATLMHTVGCNALHPVEQRCAKWLLQTGDRVGRDEFALTQDVLADVLGVRRASVTLCAQDLVRRGAIEYGHKRIAIRNRARLEATACECYHNIRAHFERLLPQEPPPL